MLDLEGFFFIYDMFIDFHRFKLYEKYRKVRAIVVMMKHFRAKVSKYKRYPIDTLRNGSIMKLRKSLKIQTISY